MANLTIEQPSIVPIKAEVHEGLSGTRSKNLPLSNYSVSKSIYGSTIYSPKNDKRHFLDFLEKDHRPYLTQLTCVVESPMKLYVRN